MSRDGETTIWFFLVFLPASARGSVVPSLRETVSFWPLREALLFPCILLSVCMRDFSLLSVLWLVDARIPHVVISHGPLTMLLLHDSANQNSMFRRD